MVKPVIHRVISDWKWISIIGGVLGILVAWSSLGFTLPWATASKSYVDEKLKPCEDKLITLDKNMATIDGKLDVIILMLDKKE
jgi:hypothetical protein